jgi:iron-regulated transporter 1
MAKSDPLALKILVSRLLTRSGDQAWDFAVPITLVNLLPQHLSLVAFLYFCSKLGSLVLQPWAASAIDRWKRINSALLGTCIQLVGLVLVVGAIVIIAGKVSPGSSSVSFFSPLMIAAFGVVVMGTVMSNLGSSLMDIAVGNDWVPVLVPPNQLGAVNSRLRQIDLATEVSSPVLAGALLAMSSADSPLWGFLMIAVWNLLSFGPEMLLLRNVFQLSPSLQKSFTTVSENQRTGFIGTISQGWQLFRGQPIFLVMVANAALWISVISPHGALLTGFLKGSWNLDEVSLGIFRGLGAVFGLAATMLFPIARQRFGLIRSASSFLVMQAVLLVVSVPFFVAETGGGWVFLGLVLLSRIGLYGFSLGETELRQCVIAEGQRGSVNGVAGSLTSLATLVLFGLASVLSDHDNFVFLIVISVFAVCAAAAVFGRWSKGNLARGLL